MRIDDFGASKFADSIESVLNLSVSRIIISPLYLRDSDTKILVIIGSDKKYTSAELQMYNTFVKNGGVLLIFEDFGNARTVAGTFGITYMDGVIRETNPLLYTNAPDKPMVFEHFISNLIEGFAINPIQLNRATAVVDLSGFLVGTTFPVLYTEKNGSAFLDVDDDNKIDSTDKIGPLPIGVLKFYEKGLVVAFGDATLPLNIYWQKKGKIGETEFVYGNAIFSLLLISYLASLVNAEEILFDETHLSPQFNSLTGLTSWIISAWIGISSGQGFALTTAIIGFTLALSQYGKLKNFRKKWKKIWREKKSRSDFISNPTRAERILSEYYILYEIMGDRLLHTANLSLLNKIEKTIHDTSFRKTLENTYGPLEQISSVSTLWEINQKINQYIYENMALWL